MPRVLASAQNELTPPATSSTVFPTNSSGSSRKYWRYSSKVRPSSTTRASWSPRFVSIKKRGSKGYLVTNEDPICNLCNSLTFLTRQCFDDLEEREGAVVVSSNANPRIIANSPEIEITIGSVTSGIERRRSSDARIRVRLTHECRLESGEVPQIAYILQGALENKERIVSR